jgi:signal recognition particle subunit SRP54
MSPPPKSKKGRSGNPAKRAEQESGAGSGAGPGLGSGAGSLLDLGGAPAPKDSADLALPPELKKLLG